MARRPGRTRRRARERLTRSSPCRRRARARRRHRRRGASHSRSRRSSARSSASTSARRCSEARAPRAAETSSSSRRTRRRSRSRTPSFDLACTRARSTTSSGPSCVVAELARVTRRAARARGRPARPGGPAEADRARPLRARARPVDQPPLTDGDLRALFAANDLELRKFAVDREPRELDHYLDLAGCEGDARERARALAPQPLRRRARLVRPDQARLARVAQSAPARG